MTVRLGLAHLDIATAGGHIPDANPIPTVIARHVIAPDGAGAMVRDHGHVVALEQAAMAAATPAAPHRRKQRIPPGQAARAAAQALRAATSPATGSQTDAETKETTTETVIDLARYAAAAQGRNTLTRPDDRTDTRTQ